MFGQYLTTTRKQKPMIHSITNYVTANDCANMLFACGASPCMTDDVDEVADIVGLSSGLTVNLGTLNDKRFEAMILAATAAGRSNKPIVFDPVGAGGSYVRTSRAEQFLSLSTPTVIRGNLSEIKVLSEVKVNNKKVFGGLTRGVDSPLNDFRASIDCSIGLSKKTGSIIVVSGSVDVVTDGKSIRFVNNGDQLLTSITGSGCMMSSVITAFVSANPDNALDAATAAVCAMGICGQIAKERMTDKDGNASFRNYLIDAMFNLDAETIDRMEDVKIQEVKNEDN